VVLTDLLVSGEKINGGIIQVQFTDDTNSEIVSKSHVTDGPVNLAMPFAGRWRGWKDARIEMLVTTSMQDATVAIGYYFVTGAGVFIFEDWDAQRS